MSKIEMNNPIVEIDGDEMARVLWFEIKKKLILPFVDLKTVYYDLSITQRDTTGDKVTHEAAAAIIKHRVGVKCATITATISRKDEYGLGALYPSPNATIRAALDGTVFRSSIMLPSFKCAVSSWKKPIIIARHAYGDIYAAAELAVQGPGKAELVWTDEDGKETRIPAASLAGAGVLQIVHNLDASIERFARSCFSFALNEKLPLLFAAKDTISKTYDGRFRDIFANVYNNDFSAQFKKAGIDYNYKLIDDAAAYVIKSEGGFVWACKNYDGDVMSDMTASACGSLAMMKSVLVSPSGAFEYEAAHGTVQKHYYRYLRGEKPCTNPVALIFAWTGALRKRGELDCLPALTGFAGHLEAATLALIEKGFMPADLAQIALVKPERALNYIEFLDAVAQRLI